MSSPLGVKFVNKGKIFIRYGSLSRNNGSRPGAWLTAELQRYRDIWRRHWVLALSFGFLYAWLIAFPLQGPFLEALVKNSRDFQSLLLFFLIGNILGLMTSGILGYFFRFTLPYFSLGVLPCVFLTLTISHTSTAVWPYVFFGLGLFSGMVVICWATTFAR